MRRLLAFLALVILLTPFGAYGVFEGTGPGAPVYTLAPDDAGCCVCRTGKDWWTSKLTINQNNPLSQPTCDGHFLALIGRKADACDTYQGSGQKCDSQFIQDVLRKRQAGATVIPVTPPELNVGIPGLEFTPQLAIKGDEPNQYFMIPWIAEYLNAIYKFGVGVAAVLAVVVIVIGGFIWLTAGGNTSQVDTARGYIQGAIIGLILALGGYTILAIINPELVNLRPLRVPYVQAQMMIAFEDNPYEDTQLSDSEKYKPGSTKSSVTVATQSGYTPFYQSDPTVNAAVPGEPKFVKWGCLISSTAMAIHKMSGQSTPAQLAIEMVKGQNLSGQSDKRNLNATAAVKKYGLSIYTSNPTIESITKELAAGNAVIGHVSNGSSGHFFIIDGAYPDYATIIDPGRQANTGKISWDQLLKKGPPSSKGVRPLVDIRVISK